MILAVDVGGTFIKYALIKDEQLEQKGKVSTPDGSEIIKVIKEIYKTFEKENLIEGIAISSAGHIDAKEGKVKYASENIPNYTGQELKKELEQDLGLKVSVDNDVTSCLYNYEEENLLYIALGTGVGGAYRTDCILRGDNSAEMEIGYMGIAGSTKTFEELCSARALLNTYNEQNQTNITGEQFNELYLADDEQAMEVLEQYFIFLAKGIANLIHVLDPKLIILGGGITEAEFFNIELLNSKIKNNTNILENRHIKIEKSELGNDAALLGAYKKYKLEEKNNG